jgi:undecaprenyl-diphosphatase
MVSGLRAGAGLMEDWLRQMDQALLKLFNVDWANPIMDQFWLYITHLERHSWLMMVVLPLLIVYLVLIYRWSSLKLLAVLGFTVMISDILAYRVIKHLYPRARPFENPALADWLRHVGDAHGPSFPSNHAANSFAGAMILSWYFPRAAKWFYILALLISISRIALGVHYPSDVAGGIFLGFLVGFFVRFFILAPYPALELREYRSGWRTPFIRD